MLINTQKKIKIKNNNNNAADLLFSCVLKNISKLSEFMLETRKKYMQGG